MHCSIRRVVHAIAVASLMPALGAATASAQTGAPPAAQADVVKPKGEPKWTVTIHGGTTAGATPAGGSAGQFPAGTTFMTDVGFPSRANSSWFYGDGAALFNEVRARFASQFNINFPQIAALDRMLTSGAVARGGGPAFGVRLGRRITSRFGIEVGFDRSTGTLGFSGGARDAIEAARASFEGGFNGLLATIPQTGLRVTSTADVGEAEGSQTVMTGALTIALVNSGRFTAHALAGGGRIANGGDSLQARLRGGYQFRLFDTYAYNESDNVTITVTERDSTPVGLLGGGFTYDVGRRHGLRADVRALVGSNGITTSVDATPSAATSTPANALPSNTNPSIQFSNLSGVRSSLSGATTRLETFTGGGLDTRMLFTVGYFVRF